MIFSLPWSHGRSHRALSQLRDADALGNLTRTLRWVWLDPAVLRGCALPSVNPGMKWSFAAELFRWDAEGASWRFVRLPVDLAEDIRIVAETRGFGSVKVDVRVGDTTWSTSIFPEKASGSFVLPVKKQVRDAEGLDDGDTVTVELALAAAEG